MMQTPLIHHLSNNSNRSILNSSSNVTTNTSNVGFMATLTALNEVNQTQEEGLINLEAIPMDELLQSIFSELLSLDLSSLNQLIDAESSDEEANIKIIEQWLEDSDSKQSFLTVIALLNQLSQLVEEPLSLQGNMADKYGDSPLELKNLADPLHNMQPKKNSSAKLNLIDLLDISPETLELMNKLINDTDKKSSLQFIQLFNVISKTTVTDLESMDVLTDQELLNILQKTLKVYQSNSSEYFKSSFPNEQTSFGRLEQPISLMNQIIYQTNAIPDEGVIQPLGNHNIGTVFNNDVIQSTNAEVVKLPIEAQKFTQEMSQFVFKTIRFSQFNGIAEARISLIPQQLGQVDVHMKLENGQLVTQFMADKLIGKEMIESQLPQLRLALQNLGIQVDKVEVVQMDSTSSSQLFQGETNQQFSQQYKQQDQSSDKYDNFLNEDLEIDMLNESLTKISGRGFDVTA
ncbi:flagellar hook-length control protein FliK [Chengkuizengella sediminis]|uniref:flagellar hook-length control protein FliK n=1 Tax=Chengkuizengella sediminis TaxID=1885917 RepID=UPI00138A5719|nr:flagellar hook-length control protein FliK [Chengkuizengella sediminis]NDI33387.1 flagellar hook-length control protein FliK [Chengkuizengella sediminis]